MADYLMSVAVFVGSFLLMFLAFRRLRNSTTTSLRRPPCLTSFPLIGSALSLPKFGNMHAEFLKLSSVIGGIIAFKMGSKYGVILQIKKILQEALVKKSTIFADRSVSFAHLVVNPGRNGIIDRLYDSTFKKSHRRSLTILRHFGFGSGVMEARINVEVEELIAWIRELGGSSFFPDPLLARSVMNVIGSIVFGRRFGRHDAQRDSFLEDLYTFTTNLWKIMPINTFPPLRFLPGFHGPFRNEVATHDRMMEFVRDNVRRSIDDADAESFVSCYRDQSAEDFDPVELDYIIRDLIVAGTETSVTSIRWALAMFANHRQVQTRVQREIDAVVPPTRLPSLDERSQLPYVDATVLELMRRRTVAPLSVPRQTAADTEVHGYFVPAKTMVFASLYAAHMDPEVWQDPEAFRPERFLNDSGKVIGRERLIPFGLGRRSCLGELLARQEMFLFIAGLAQSFDILPPEGQDHVDISDILGITLAPKPFNVRLVARR